MKLQQQENKLFLSASDGQEEAREEEGRQGVREECEQNHVRDADLKRRVVAFSFPLTGCGARAVPPDCADKTAAWCTENTQRPLRGSSRSAGFLNQAAWRSASSSHCFITSVCEAQNTSQVCCLSLSFNMSAPASVSNVLHFPEFLYMTYRRHESSLNGL